MPELFFRAPILEIIQYARKHKCLERRSALHMKRRYPSRIDLGEDKYDGPFTVEEVEDVKTIFRLLALITCMCTAMYISATQCKSFEEYYDERPTITW